MDLGGLNESQRAAVCCIDGPLLVLAGAGSGKTRVITHRIAYMLERGIRPESIVALSFTNKAADEMRERLARMVGRRAGELVLGTFHSLGVRMMRARPEDFGVPKKFSILDQGDVYGLIRSILRDEGIHFAGADRRFDPGAIVQRISLWKNAFITPAQAQDPDKIESDYDEVAAEVYGPYEERLASLGAVDFDDLVCRIARALKSSDAAREYWQARFSHVLVDEYQDTNKAQFEVLRELVGARQNLCVVGDDDQAIYGWRGAKVANILGFDMYFPSAVTIKLEENYRSCAPILDCANAVIVNNQGRHDKVLLPQRDGGEPVTEVLAEDGPQETNWVTSRIRQLIKEEGVPGHAIAVLYRSTRQARSVEERLQEHGLAYRVLGGQAMYDKKQVKDALAYLKVLIYPTDEIAVRRAMNVPSRGIGGKSLERLLAHASAQRLSLMEAIHRCDDVPGIGGRPADGLRRFSELVRFGQSRMYASGSAALALRELLDRVALRDHVMRELGSSEAAAHRWADVERLLASVERFEQRAREAGQRRARWNEFFGSMTLERDKKDAGEDAGARGQVTLATLHSAKGLEWPVVFIIGCEEGIMPHKRVDAPRISDAIAGDVEEERRLFYVGITRARDRLFLTRAAARFERGRQVKCLPSRFLEELPEAVTRYNISTEESLTVEKIESMADAFLAKLALAKEAAASEDKRRRGAARR
ncbi:MAG: UvrD-helicase domain-containing protein [Myxococcales bacterium]|nr:UvrD-helicase domain-containing protein [Myxococcales bacterium]